MSAIGIFEISIEVKIMCLQILQRYIGSEFIYAFSYSIACCLMTMNNENAIGKVSKDSKKTETSDEV